MKNWNSRNASSCTMTTIMPTDNDTIPTDITSRKPTL